MLIQSLKVGQYFQLATNEVYKVVCNDWWSNEQLKDFICVDQFDNKKHFSFFDNTVKIVGATLVTGFNQEKAICRNCGFHL